MPGPIDTIASRPATAPVTSGASAAPAVDPKVTEAAQKLEGVFMSHLVDQMLKSAGIGDSQPIYSGLLTEKLGDHLAQAGGIGLAALVSSQLGAGAAAGGKETP